MFLKTRFCFSPRASRDSSVAACPTAVFFLPPADRSVESIFRNLHTNLWSVFVHGDGSMAPSTTTSFNTKVANKASDPATQDRIALLHIRRYIQRCRQRCWPCSPVRLLWPFRFWFWFLFFRCRIVGVVLGPPGRSAFALVR